VHIDVHQNHVDLAQSVPSLQRHVIVKWLRQNYLHLVCLGESFEPLGDLEMR